MFPFPKDRTFLQHLSHDDVVDDPHKGQNETPVKVFCFSKIYHFVVNALSTSLHISFCVGSHYPLG